MHEHAIAKVIIKNAFEHALKLSSNKNSKKSILKKIVVECGQLAELPCEDLKIALIDEIKLSEYKNIDLEIIESKAKVNCEKCNFIGEPKIAMHSHDVNVFFCPKCGSVPKILEGNVIKLKSIIVE